ncbi:MAG: rhomboid family intramembrane serine protease [Proteobacteria bacterium]|nr:rhomboid family intramembrane serine protease [Pseudomonadota bacterium]
MAALIILVVTIIVSVIGLSSPRVIERSLLRPHRVANGSGYAELLTSGFVHADVAHMLFNLITFYSFAFKLEPVIGSVKFLVLYFGSLLIANLGTVFQHRNDPDYASLGASGAILGVLFASIVYFPRQSLYILPLPVPIPAPLFAVGYLAYTWYSSRNRRGNINHDAHLFGALAGLAFVFLTDPTAITTAVRSFG